MLILPVQMSKSNKCATARPLREMVAALFISLSILLSLSAAGESCDQSLLPKYQTARMAWRYHGENLVPRPVMKWLGKDIQYLDKAAAEKLEAMHNGQGWVYALTGEPVRVPGEELYLIVMDAFGRIYIGLEQDADGLHHSSITRGRPLAAAGVVAFDSSDNIRLFTDDTGHYYRSFNKKPGLNWTNLSRELEFRGINPANIVNFTHSRNRSRLNLRDQIRMRLIGW